MEKLLNTINSLITHSNDSDLFIIKEIVEKMQRKSIIVFIQCERIETYGNLKKCCEFENLKYHTLARLKFPIRINDVVIHKTLFK